MAGIKTYCNGGAPVTCDICGETLAAVDGKSFVDGATKHGPWANMCHPKCFKVNGRGLGTGRGQRYAYQTEHKAWVKVEG